MAEKHNFPGATASAPPQQGYPPAQAVGYPPAQGGYPQPQAGYPPQAGYQPQGGYPSPQGGYPQPQSGYPPPQAGYPQPQAGYPPPQGSYPPAQGGYPAAQGSYPAGQYPQGGYQAGAPPGGAPQYGAKVPGQPPQELKPPLAGDNDDDIPDENPNAKELEATAPPLSTMDNIAGYSNMTFDGALAPPPSYDEVTQGPPPERGALDTIPMIEDDVVREALLNFASQECCYGKSAARDMHIQNKEATSAFHYTLESFGEGRQTAWTSVPFRGQPIDGPQNGTPPGPWDIAVKPLDMFTSSVAEAEVPHTASVKVCHNCGGMCRVLCHHCHGRGVNRCISCHGRGHRVTHLHGERQTRSCISCHGSGRKRCTWCHGYGMVNCKTCEAQGQIKCYIKLTLTWTNHLEDYILEKTDLPDELIRNVSGQTAFEEQAYAVWPVNHFPNQNINEASHQLVQQHRVKFPTERILMQRHRVRIVPVTRVTSAYKNKPFHFFVYGFEHKVHAPEYPQQCCWGCAIL